MASILSYALTSLSDVKESLGIPSSDTSKDNLITRKINQATIAIENYCGRRFALTTYTDESYNGSQIDQIVLKNRPIVGAVSLSVRDTSLNDNDFTDVESSLVFVDSDSGIINLDFRAVGRWSRYSIDYSAGYTTIPADLAEAAASLAAYYVQNADGSNIGVAEKQEGQRRLRLGNNNHTLSFANISAQLGIDSILNSYANYPITGGMG